LVIHLQIKQLIFTQEKSEVSIEQAINGDDIENTVKVMGGEDWEMWIDALKAEIY
jgi:enoyl-[acyl-carrier protein] reductase/trans-2-enoyl-CoA reductase (NAD+)